MYIIHQGDALTELQKMQDQSVQCCVTSPPYWGLRDYGIDGQLGLEPTPDEYVASLVEVFRGVWRVLRDDGTLWLNLGDCYAGKRGGKSNFNQGFNERCGTSPGQRKQELAVTSGLVERDIPPGLKDKDLIGIPWRVAFALQADGWYLRQDIIWHKPNPMPESVRDRCTKSHEYIFLLTKQKKYYYDHEAVKEDATGRDPGNKSHKYEGTGDKKHRTKEGLLSCGPKNKRNRRDVWTVASSPFKGAHFATFPPKLIEPCILAGCPKGEVVIDPFAGAGTVGLVSKQHGRDFVGIELNPEYCEMARKRIEDAK